MPWPVRDDNLEDLHCSSRVRQRVSDAAAAVCLGREVWRPAFALAVASPSAARPLVRADLDRPGAAPGVAD